MPDGPRRRRRRSPPRPRHPRRHRPIARVRAASGRPTRRHHFHRGPVPRALGRTPPRDRDNCRHSPIRHRTRRRSALPPIARSYPHGRPCPANRSTQAEQPPARGSRYLRVHRSIGRGCLRGPRRIPECRRILRRAPDPSGWRTPPGCAAAAEVRARDRRTGSTSRGLPPTEVGRGGWWRDGAGWVRWALSWHRGCAGGMSGLPRRPGVFQGLWRVVAGVGYSAWDKIEVFGPVGGRCYRARARGDSGLADKDSRRPGTGVSGCQRGRPRPAARRP